MSNNPYPKSSLNWQQNIQSRFLYQVCKVHKILTEILIKGGKKASNAITKTPNLLKLNETFWL